jgi:5-methylcytosine-specific restriction protein A
VTRLSSSAREKLYDAEAAKAEAAGLGSLPICNICGDPIDGTRERWHESHDPKIPKHMGGAVTGIAHERCNLEHNHQHDTPLFWKMKRVRWRHIGAKVSNCRPMPGTRASGIRKRMNGKVEPWGRR